MLGRDIIAVYSENRMKHTNRQCEKKNSFSTLKYSNKKGKAIPATGRGGT
jgi:hypothetical protein